MYWPRYRKEQDHQTCFIGTFVQRMNEVRIFIQQALQLLTRYRRHALGF